MKLFKIFDVTTAKSTKIGRVKFKTNMPYFDSETAVGYMNIPTGDCFYQHKNAIFWGYNKYSQAETFSQEYFFLKKFF